MRPIFEVTFGDFPFLIRLPRRRDIYPALSRCTPMPCHAVITSVRSALPFLRAPKNCERSPHVMLGIPGIYLVFSQRPNAGQSRARKNRKEKMRNRYVQ